MSNSLRYMLNRVDRFLFQSCEPIICSLMRMYCSVLLIIYTLMWMLEADIWFTDEGVLRAATAQELWQHDHWSILFWLPSTYPAVMICLALLLGHSVLMLLGCWSRVQAVCIFIWLVSFQHRNGLITDGQDVLLRWLVFCLIFMPLDYSWSLGRYAWSKKRVASTAAGCSLTVNPTAWALRLVQFQITVIYLSTAWEKWQGQTWRDGSALYYVSLMDDLFGKFWLPSFLYESQSILVICTWCVVLLEAALPLFLWLPWTRRGALLVAICFHLAIEYSMNLFLFEWLMILGLISFSRTSDWVWLAQLVPTRGTRSFKNSAALSGQRSGPQPSESHVLLHD